MSHPTLPGTIAPSQTAASGCTGARGYCAARLPGYLVAAVLMITALPSFAQSTYSPGGWPTLHHDAGNRRSVDVALLGNDYRPWEALAGASVLTAPVTSPDGKRLYVTTGLAEGHSNLHAFTVDGEPLWHSAPWNGPDQGVDPCALLSSPIVDREGDIYLSDCNQLFAFRPDGSAKWTIALPSPREGDWAAAGDHPVNAFTTAAFTGNGNILGVTNFGDVVIVDRESGEVLNAPYRLPALLAPYSETVPLPDSLLGRGLMDPRFREWAWQLIFGGSMRSANTPAVSRGNRVFVVGSSARENIGALFGLDLDTSGALITVREAFITEIGIGSGSSPALSPAEDQVYVSDEEGWFYGIDSLSGEILWKVKTTAAAGAAAVGPDGVVYALQSSGPGVVAIDPDGDILWHGDITGLDSGLPDSWLFGEAVGVANGNPTVTGDAVLVPVLYGYPMPLADFNIPVASYLVALDIATGAALRALVTLADDSSGITAVLPDGTLANSLGATTTSAMAPLKPLVDWLLPGDTEMLGARGGIQVSRPLRKARVNDRD